MTRFAFKEFQGLLPALDRKRLEEPFVIDGNNFTVTLDGPLSSFARETISFEAFANPEAMQTIRVLGKTEAYFMTTEGIFRYDLASDQMVPIFLIGSPGTPLPPFPWTSGTCGGKQYFAREGVGLIEFNGLTNTWTVLTGGSVPTDIVACTQSQGRLIVLAAGVVAWSAIDDGRDFTTSSATGAGFLSLSIINSLCTCAPQAVLEYANGFIVYTTEGMLRMEAVNAIVPFRHKVLSRKHIPLNPYCVLEVGQYQHIMLTKAGFFSTEEGRIPAPWQPVMSEFMHLSIVPKLDVSIPAVVRLDTDFDRQVFMVSFSPEQLTGLYNKSFVLYLPSQKWGSFDRPHTGLIDVYLSEGPDAGFHWGYCDTEGTIFEFYGGANDLMQLDPVDSIWYHQFRLDVEYPAITYHDGTTETTTFTIAGFLDTNTDGDRMRAVGRPGLYNRRFSLETALSAGTIQGLTEAITYPELITNGTFDSWPAGWSVDPGVLASVSLGILSYNRNNAPSGACFIRQTIQTEIGQTYKVQLQVVAKTAPIVVYWNDNIGIDWNGITPAVISFTFVATTTETEIRFGTPAVANGTLQVDDFTVFNNIADMADTTYFKTELTLDTDMERLTVGVEQLDLRQLDSWIDIGLFRAGENLDLSELSQVHELAISTEAVALREILEDYIADFVGVPESQITFDWQTLTGEEDWGLGEASDAAFQVSIHATLDGYKVWQVDGVNIEQDLEFYLLDRKTSLYSTDISSLYHFVRIKTALPGDQFHLKLVELNMEPAGFLY